MSPVISKLFELYMLDILHGFYTRLRFSLVSRPNMDVEMHFLYCIIQERTMPQMFLPLILFVLTCLKHLIK